MRQELPALLAIWPPFLFFNSTLYIGMPGGIFLNSMALPIFISAVGADIISSFAFKPSGLMIYRLSPSVYCKSAILPLLAGSYWIEITLAGILYLFRLKSMILTICF